MERQDTDPQNQEVDWASLETHIVDGVWSPPLKDELPGARTRRPRLNPTLHNEVISTILFRYDGATSTFKTTSRRLRAHAFCSLITLRNEATGGRVPFELKQVVRSGSDWRSMKFKSTSRSHPNLKLIVLNVDPIEGSRVEREVRITQNGLHWTAEFDWSERGAVERAGFRFCPVERRWITRDPKVAAKFDTSLRAEIERQTRELRETMPTTVIPRAERQRRDQVAQRIVRRPIFRH